MRDALDNGDTIRIEGIDYPDYPAMAEQFCRAVVEKRVVYCRYIVLACKRYLAMLEPAFQAKHGIYFSPEDAVESCAFIETLHHVEGEKAGENLILDPWQIWLQCAIYGFRYREDGIRVVNTVYAEVPRKHGKSLIAAGNALLLTTADARRGDHLYIIAPKMDQAKKVLNPMREMVESNKALAGFYDVKLNKENGRVGSTRSDIVCLAANGEKEDGHNPKTVIADEFHAVPPEIYKVMKSSQRARAESMFWQMGSAGRHTFGVGWDERRHAIKVLEGEVEELHTFACIFTVDPEDQAEWHTERVIRKANPGIGSSIDLRKIVQDAAGSRHDPVKRVEFLRTALNLWGYSESALFPREKWDRCAIPSLSLGQMKGKRGWLALDLASRNDMVAAVALFEEETGELLQRGDNLVPDVELFAFAWYFVPKDGPWREDEDLLGVYEGWNERGFLNFTPGSRHRFNEVRDLTFAMLDQFNIEMVLIDDQQANELFNALQDKDKPVVAFRKNAPNFSDPTKDIMARVNGEERGLFHSGHPVLGWNMANVIGGPDTADRILGKKPSPNSNQKIDGFDCLVMANAGRLNSQKLLPAPATQSGSVVHGLRRL